MAENTIQEKSCTRCKRTFTADHFHRRSAKGGLVPQCKDCVREARWERCPEARERVLAQTPIDGERWLPISGLEGRYEVSSAGRVRKATETWGMPRGYILKPGMTDTGYLTVSLTLNKKGRSFYVHRLVVDAFIQPIQPGARFQVNHKNGNKTDNRVENLEYVTHHENTAHAIRAGLRKPNKKPVGILTAAMVRRLRALKIEGRTNEEVGRTLGISPTHVGNVWRGRYWRHVK